MTLIAELGALLVQGAAAVPETTIVRSIATSPPWYTIVREVGGVVTMLVFLVLMLLLLPIVFRLRKTVARFEALMSHVQRSIDPVSKHAANIADNVDYISTSIRADVQEIRRTLLSANSGVREALEASERRLHELGAVLRVVQEEAEHAFVTTASTLRGLGAGAASLRDEGARTARTDDALGYYDEDEDDDFDAALDAAEDTDDGYDDGPTLGRQKPRIKRTRRGGQG